MRAIFVAAGAAAIVAGSVELALFLGAEQLDSTTGREPGAGIPLAGFLLLAFALVVPVTAGLVGGLTSREPHGVIGSVAGLFVAAMVGLLSAGARADLPAMFPVLLGLVALSLLTVMGHFLALSMRIPAARQ